MHFNPITNQPPLAVVATIILTLLPLYYASYQYRIRHPYISTPPLSDEKRPSPSDFVRTWLNTQLIEPFNPYPIALYCNQSEWHPNLVFNLDNANGGIGNVRGNMLDFLFQAIEAGASIILPGMASRSPTDISNVWASRADFDQFFDEEWFLKTMVDVCPEMAIYKPQPGHDMAPALKENYLPKTRRVDEDFDNSKKAYLEHLDNWLRNNPDFQKDELNLVNVERTLWDIDTRSLPLGLRRNFGQLLRINPSIRRFAAVVVQNLQGRWQVNLDIDPRDAIPAGAFYGAHLRTEADAEHAGWLSEGVHGNFSAQTDAYIAEAVRHGLGIMYVASGNETDLQRFKEKAAAHTPAVVVTSKFDLLPEQEAAALRELTWDQQALVDYEVLQRCSLFGGFVKSSFSYNVGMVRNQWMEDRGKVMDPFRVQHSEVGVSFDDGVSRILGRDDYHEHRIPRGIWP